MKRLILYFWPKLLGLTHKRDRDGECACDCGRDELMREGRSKS